MILKTLVVGELQCNCIILGCEKTEESVIIDPGDEPERILKIVSEHKLNVKQLLQTHAHIDHIGGAKGIIETTGAPILLHKNDQFLFDNLQTQAYRFGLEIDEPSRVDKFIAEDDEIVFGKDKMRVIHTPGHSPGSVCFHIDGEQSILLSGDTLFCRSIGRTDLFGGSFEQIIESIRNKLFKLPDDTVVYPGHGPGTTIGDEKRYNPFLAKSTNPAV